MLRCKSLLQNNKIRKRRLLALIIFTLNFSYTLFAQLPYTTTFNAGNNWTLNSYNNLNITTEGDMPNMWYISDNESGKPVGSIGGANCGNPTLHVGSTSLGDMGAAYDAGGCTNFGFGPCAACASNGLYCVTTDRSAVSPVISTVGASAITLSFTYIHWGTALLDNAQIIYSTNGGTSYTLLSNLAKSGCCAGNPTCASGCTTNNANCTGTHQGKWQQYTSTLPAACNNIPNLIIGFRWYNDDISTAGRDPSVAIDNLSLSTGVLPLGILNFYTSPNRNSITIHTQLSGEEQSDSLILQRSTDGIHFLPINTFSFQKQTEFDYSDDNVSAKAVYYYQLKGYKNNSQILESQIISGTVNSYFNSISANYYKNFIQIFNFNGTIESAELFDVKGTSSTNITSGIYGNKIYVGNLSNGVYMLWLNNDTIIKLLVHEQQ